MSELITPPAELTEGLSPSAAARAIEAFHRSIAIGEFLDEQVEGFKGAATCLETYAGFLELLGDCITQLRTRGMLQRDSDARAVRMWLLSKADQLRSEEVVAPVKEPADFDFLNTCRELLELASQEAA